MPFTLCHPAAVLPIGWIAKHRVNLLALAIGSMVPDLSYFATGLHFISSEAHTVERSFSFGLPMGALLFVLAKLFEREFLALLPAKFRLHRAAERRLSSANEIIRVLVCLLVGYWTHIAWDGFVRNYAWLIDGVRWFLFDERGPYPFSHLVLAGGSTALGAVAIAVSIQRKYSLSISDFAKLPSATKLVWSALFTLPSLNVIFATPLAPSEDFSTRVFVHGLAAFRDFVVLFAATLFVMKMLMLVSRLAPPTPVARRPMPLRRLDSRA